MRTHCLQAAVVGAFTLHTGGCRLCVHTACMELTSVHTHCAHGKGYRPVRTHCVQGEVEISGNIERTLSDTRVTRKAFVFVTHEYLENDGIILPMTMPSLIAVMGNVRECARKPWAPSSS